MAISDHIEKLKQTVQDGVKQVKDVKAAHEDLLKRSNAMESRLTSDDPDSVYNVRTAGKALVRDINVDPDHVDKWRGVKDGLDDAKTGVSHAAGRTVDNVKDISSEHGSHIKHALVGAFDTAKDMVGDHPIAAGIAGSVAAGLGALALRNKLKRMKK